MTVLSCDVSNESVATEVIFTKFTQSHSVKHCTELVSTVLFSHMVDALSVYYI